MFVYRTEQERLESQDGLPKLFSYVFVVINKNVTYNSFKIISKFVGYQLTYLLPFYRFMSLKNIQIFKF